MCVCVCVCVCLCWGVHFIQEAVKVGCVYLCVYLCVSMRVYVYVYAKGARDSPLHEFVVVNGAVQLRHAPMGKGGSRLSMDGGAVGVGFLGGRQSQGGCLHVCLSVCLSPKRGGWQTTAERPRANGDTQADNKERK